MSKAIEKMFLKMKLDDLQETGIFAGYGSFFNVKDLQRDTVLPGAFKRTIKNNGGVFPMLFNHRPEKEIAITESAKEDNNGLFVKGKLYISDDPREDLPDARATYIRMKRRKEAGKPIGLSIGYEPKAWEYDPEDSALPDWQRGRLLKEIKLWEISIVTFPANEQATIQNIKSTEEEINTFMFMIEDFKEGRVLSRANRGLVKELIDKLKALLDAAGGGDDDSDSDSEKSLPLAALKELADNMSTRAARLETYDWIEKLKRRTL